MYFKVIKSGTNRKLVYDFLLIVYSNFCRIAHRPFLRNLTWNSPMPKVIDSCITWKLSCDHVCKMFGRHWPNEPKIILPETTFPGLHFCRWQYMVALQVFKQFCPKARDANPLVAEPETDFNAKWTFKVIQGHLFWYHWRATKGLHSII